MTSDIKIAIAGVVKAFGPKQVLTGVDLDIRTGQSMVVIGGSGTGKSVLLKCVLGLMRPEAGSIAIDGQETVGLSTRRRAAINKQIGMLFQGGALFDSLPVWENVCFGPLQRGEIARHDARDRAVEVLAKVNLGADAVDRMPAELSGGMQKRVGLARAIAAEPAVLFFDEPTTGLDPITADVINDLIRSVTRDLGATALSITHDMASVRKIADRVAMLYQGKVIWQGGVEEVDTTDNPYVRQFVAGDSHGPIPIDVRAA